MAQFLYHGNYDPVYRFEPGERVYVHYSVTNRTTGGRRVINEEATFIQEKTGDRELYLIRTHDGLEVEAFAWKIRPSDKAKPGSQLAFKGVV